MAPEQGPDSKSNCEKKETSANEEESSQNYVNSKHDKPSTSETLQKDTVGWIYILRKDQLIEQCRNAGIPTTGFTVEHLRRQLSENLRTKRMRASTENLLRQLEEQIQSAEKSVVYEDSISLPVPLKPARCDLSDTEIMMSIQKWNLNYSGETDLMEFLERFEELAESYRIPFDRLLPAMLIILSGNALKWYRVKRDTINTWAVFRHEIEKFFLPNRYLSHLEQSFYNRKQNGLERAKDYILTMLTMSRKHPQLRRQNHLDRIYYGLRTEYRHYVRRNDFKNLDELISLTDDFETLKREERPQTSHMVADTVYSRETRCWRCKRTGHKRTSCTKPYRLFCSYCGLDGVFSRDCECRNQINPIREETFAKTDGRYYISVRINGKIVHALIDTGASRTYIGEPLKKHLLRLGVNPLSSRGMVQMADQSLATCLDVFPIEVIYEGKRTQLQASVISTLAESMVLGIDFLSALNFELRLGGEVLERSSLSEEAETLYSLTSPDLLSEEENKTRFNNIDQLGILRQMERKPTMSRKIMQKDKANKPSAFQPPPERRPRIISDIQIRPQTAHAQPPPPLAYRTPIQRQVKIALTATTIQISPPPVSFPTPRATIEAPLRPVLSARPIPTVISEYATDEVPTTSKSAPVPGNNRTTAPKTPKPKARRYPKYTEEQVFENIKINKPRRNTKHKQYLVHRPSFPPLKVTILNRDFVRLRCQGHVRVVAMVSEQSARSPMKASLSKEGGGCNVELVP